MGGGGSKINMEEVSSALDQYSGINLAEVKAKLEALTVERSKARTLRSIDFDKVCGLLGIHPEAGFQIYQMFDKNHDRLLDIKELAMLVAFVMRGTAEQKLEVTFKVLDADDSGFLDTSEITEFIKTSRQWVQDSELHLTLIQTQLDLANMQSGDSAEEKKRLYSKKIQSIKALRAKMPPANMSDAEIDQLVSEVFAKFDTNHDNKISPEEFVAGFSAHPEVTKYLSCF
ncbi:hypothetical protein Pelo_5540 [Pelomyxa schiedti]|nr:hypothetical protein Pelo_5540 [Pelomyxa schiedti]